MYLGLFFFFLKKKKIYIYSFFQTFRGFAADYFVPLLPSVNAGQTLFYFIGLENTDEIARHGPNRVILQPVLTFGNGQAGGWYVQSWACCPEGMTVSSPPIFVSPLSSISTFCNKTSDTEAVVSATYAPSPNASSSTVLKIDLNGPPYFQDRHFNWADVTLEVYNVQTCSGLSPGKIVFSNLQLFNHYYMPIPFPSSWVTTTNAPCNGKTVVGPGNQVSIQHFF